MKKVKTHHSSFRDPSGFLFYENNRLLRQVNLCYQNDYDLLMSSGLYDTLQKKKLMIPHKELSDHEGVNEQKFKVIEPVMVGFISYPYEWSFSQLKDAALITLEICKTALLHGMILKDSSAYNIQFHKPAPVLIDTLSFEKYKEGKPWEAYRQFCQHFLAPLTLMSYTDIRLNQLMKLYIDGIPIDLTSKLLPFKTRMNPSLLMHLHVHASFQKKYEHNTKATRNVTIKLANLITLVDNLSHLVKKLELKKQRTEWSDYYTFTNYSNRSFTHKKEIITRFIKELNPGSLWDLGANTGQFIHIASRLGINCIAFDVDALVVELNYRLVRDQHIENILPLVMDITNPSPQIGWNNKERSSLKNRPHPDAILALALIHHLAISNNIPLYRIAKFLSKLSDNLIIEFVPKNDSQVKKMLEPRKDIFVDYDEKHFEMEFKSHYNIIAKEKIEDSERIIYQMKKKDKNENDTGNSHVY